VKDISEKLKCVGNCYNIRTIFTTEPTLRGSFLSTRPDRNSQQTIHCICSIPCACGRSYVGGIGRPLAMWLHEHSKSFKKLKVVQPVYEEGHRVGWDEAKILDTESNSRHGKYRESSYMACLVNLISQLNLDFSPVWNLLVTKEVGSLEGRSI
jgi:hypothetical protein